MIKKLPKYRLLQGIINNLLGSFQVHPANAKFWDHVTKLMPVEFDLLKADNLPDDEVIKEKLEAYTQDYLGKIAKLGIDIKEVKVFKLSVVPLKSIYSIYKYKAKVELVLGDRRYKAES